MIFTTLQGLLRLFRILATTPTTANAAELYDFWDEFFGANGVPGERTLYLNLGYWDDSDTDYDHAAERLAKEFGEFAGLATVQDQLDVGFGFGDQDMFWAERFGVRRIVGLNVARSQVERARHRVAERGLDARIDLRHGSATAMPVGDASFDAVTSLESAFHYVTREDFFKEAYRVLRPGGVLAIADIIKHEDAPGGLVASVGERLRRASLQIPQANFYPISTYREKLRAAGFCDIETRSILDSTILSFPRRMRKRLLEARATRRIDPWTAGIAMATVSRMSIIYDTLDYVLVRARKPGQSV